MSRCPGYGNHQERARFCPSVVLDDACLECRRIILGVPSGEDPKPAPYDPVAEAAWTSDLDAHDEKLDALLLSVAEDGSIVDFECVPRATEVGRARGAADGLDEDLIRFEGDRPLEDRDGWLTGRGERRPL